MQEKDHLLYLGKQMYLMPSAQLAKLLKWMNEVIQVFYFLFYHIFINAVTTNNDGNKEDRAYSNEGYIITVKYC